jgi:CheY-like chemotaxis protein
MSITSHIVFVGQVPIPSPSVCPSRSLKTIRLESPSPRNLREAKVDGRDSEDLETILPLPKLRVLCVDDNRDTADSAGILLDIYGCEVAVCYDADTAFETVLQFKPDLCLIDLRMPNGGGCEFAFRLRAKYRELPMYLIAVTAAGSDTSRSDSLAAGFDMYMEMPIDWDKFLEVLAEIERNLGKGAFVRARLARPLNQTRLPEDTETE